MADSLRVQALMRERARQKYEQRQRKAAEADAKRAAFQREFWDRKKTAAELGISVAKLRRWITGGKGPLRVKAGDTMQARTFWRAADVRAYRDNPAAFEQAKQSAGSATHPTDRG